MRAYVLDSFEAGPQMTEVPEPEPGEGEILIRIHAVSVNPIDLAIASGDAKDWLEYRFPVTLGRDLSGVVERVGQGVERFAVGDHVFGFIARDYAHDGSFAEAVTIPEDEFVVAAPAGVDHVHAAALGLAAVTATMCLDATGVGDGSSLLVNGATGGVGGYAVQLAKARGAKLVVGSARPGDESSHISALGAGGTIDWSADGFADAARALAPDGYDALVDLVTGDPAALASLAGAVLAPAGSVATPLGAADPDRLAGRIASNIWSAPEVERLRSIASLAADGRVSAPVTRTFSFDQLPDAFDAVRAGAVGKVAVELV